MRKIKWKSGAHSGELEVEDNATDQEISDIVVEKYNFTDLTWREEKG